MMEYSTTISEEDLKRAVKRHEDKWQEELDSVDIKAVVLKCKKAVLEQSLRNKTAENAAIDATKKVNTFSNKMYRFQEQLNGFSYKVDRNTEIFKDSIETILQESRVLKEEIERLREINKNLSLPWYKKIFK